MNISINLTLVIILIVFASMAVKGYKNGLIQEVISLAALLVAIVAFALIASAIGNYLSERFQDMVIAVVFFIILMIVMSLSKLILIPVRFLSKLPIISWINKIAGLAMGMAKCVIFTWIAFIILNMFEISRISQYILKDIKANEFLLFLYQNNYIAKFF